MEMFKEKPDYIHYNPVVAGLSDLPEEYKYSSALFYETRVNNWDFVTHYLE
jgi:putative transposase